MINSLFNTNKEQFLKIKNEAKAFRSCYIGNNIIVNDIFRIIKNYASKNNINIEILRLPINDEEFYAFTCVRNGELFMVVNTYLPLVKQIFAATHELYHILCFINKQDNALSINGSLLMADDFGEIMKKEDKEANAFAGVLLVPESQLYEQMEIYGIDKNDIDIDTVVKHLTYIITIDSDK